MAIEYFCCYHSYLEVMEQLNDAEKGRLFTACLLYSKTGEAPELGGNERFVFPAFKAQIDRDNQRYEARCEQQAKNARKRWDATACDCMPTDADDAKTKEKAKEKAKAKANISPPISPSRGTRFTPPTLDEVRAYCRERQNGVDPEKWYDHYTSNGWKVGKNSMKDWRAAVRTWERQEIGPPTQTARSGNVFQEMLEERRRQG